ncbi:acyl-CoA reductase, partial [Butyricicoccus sp. 1XD8-22]
MKLFWPKESTFEQALDHLSKISPFPPFDNNVLTFIQSLSKKLVRMRHLPEIVALGYWLRQSHIKEMESIWKEENKGK